MEAKIGSKGQLCISCGLYLDNWIWPPSLVVWLLR